MKLRNYLLAGFMAVVLVLVIVAGLVVWQTNNAKDARQDNDEKFALREDLKEFNLNLYTMYQMGLEYLITTNVSMVSALEVERDNYYALSDDITTRLAYDSTLQTEMTRIKNQMGTVEASFQGYTVIIQNEMNKSIALMTASGTMSYLRGMMAAGYFENPQFSSEMSTYVVVGTATTTPRIALQQLGYAENACIWQARDAKSLADLKAATGLVKGAVAATSLPAEVKGAVDQMMTQYEANVPAIEPYISETAQEHLNSVQVEYALKIAGLKYTTLRGSYIDNPAFMGMFYQNLVYTSNSVSYNKSLDQLFFELNSNEMVVLATDMMMTTYGQKSDHYANLTATVFECKAWVDASGLNAANKTVLKSIFDTYLSYMQTLKVNQQAIAMWYVQINSQTATMIHQMDAILNDVIVGAGPSDARGLDFIMDSLQEDIDESNKTIDDAEQMINITFIVGMVVAIAVSIMLGLIITTSITKPIGEMSDYADRISKGEFDAQIGGKKNIEEVETLSNAFSRMANSYIMSMKMLEEKDGGTGAEKTKGKLAKKGAKKT